MSSRKFFEASAMVCNMLHELAPTLRERWFTVREGLAEAIRTAGRSADDVCLVAVSKYHAASAVAEIAALGQRDFGENYMQEARAKQAELAENPDCALIRWHAIGALQTNKAKSAAGHFTLVHSVDSLKLAEALARRMPAGQVQDILIQVNVGEEAQKAGVFASDLASLAEAIEDVEGVRQLGLMCLPPRCGEGEAARPWFARMRELRDALERRLGRRLPHLSMGMSGDYRQAVEEGATLVRVGTDIFGPRPFRPEI